MITNTTTDDLKPFQNAIARIFKFDGAVVGAGFLVSNQHLLTCAHVVTTALGLPMAEDTTPSNTIQLDFPFIDLEKKLEAKVEVWHPYKFNSAEKITDIAVLKLQKPIFDITLSRLITLENSSKILSENKDRFKVCGFPNDYRQGIWAYVDIKNPLPNGWVQIEGTTVQGQPVKGGFSGAPIWDNIEKAVVGMAVAADSDEQKKLAFLLPSQVLFSAWKELSSLQSNVNKNNHPPMKLNDSEQQYLADEIMYYYGNNQQKLIAIFTVNQETFGRNFYGNILGEDYNTKIVNLVIELIKTTKLESFITIIKKDYPNFAIKL